MPGMRCFWISLRHCWSSSTLSIAVVADGRNTISRALRAQIGTLVPFVSLEFISTIIAARYMVPWPKFACSLTGSGEEAPPSPAPLRQRIANLELEWNTATRALISASVASDTGSRGFILL